MVRLIVAIHIVVTIAWTALYAMTVMMTTSYACRAVTRVAEVATVPAIMHTEVLSVNRAEVLSASIVVAT